MIIVAPSQVAYSTIIPHEVTKNTISNHREHRVHRGWVSSVCPVASVVNDYFVCFESSW